MRNRNTFPCLRSRGFVEEGAAGRECRARHYLSRIFRKTRPFAELQKNQTHYSGTSSDSGKNTYDPGREPGLAHHESATRGVHCLPGY